MRLVEGVAFYQPVIQAKNGAFCWGASMYAQKYGPPEVGMDESISAMQAPIMSAIDNQSGSRHVRISVILKMLTMIQPMAMTPGPPVLRPYAKRLWN